MLSVIDDYNREAIGMKAEFCFPAERVVWELKQMISLRLNPLLIRCGNGPEYFIANIQTKALEWEIRLESIQPSNPQQNAYVEKLTEQ
jgi:putative transposase